MQNPYLHLLREAWRYGEGRRGKIALAYVLFIAANLTLLAEPWVLGLTINEIQKGGPDLLWRVLGYLWIFAGITLLFWLFHGTARVIERENSFHTVTRFNDTLFSGVMSLPMRWHKDHHSGNTISRLRKAGAALESFTDDSYLYVQTLVKSLGSLVGILILLPQFAFAAVPVGILCIFLIFRFDRVLIGQRTEINEKWHHVATAVHDYLTNIVTVITLRLEALARSEYLRRVGSILPLFRKNIRLNEIKWFCVNLGLLVLYFFTIFGYLFFKLKAGAPILIGSLMALYQYTERFVNSFFDIAWQYEKLVNASTDLKSIDVIKQAIAVNVKREGKRADIRGWKKIEIKNLSFRHASEEENTHKLEGISLSLRRGKKTALVGESGGGKSTIMSLLRGLMPAEGVRLSIDGRNFKTLKPLYDHVTLIPQDPEIFENTIEYNITAGLSHTQKEVEEALRLARFDVVLKRLPKGLQTNVKEKGVNLSGGEKQRLALARGIFAAKKSCIILMDEPTSSVDAQNELAIYRGMFAKFKKDAVVSSIHRLHLLPLFDEVIVLDRGQVIERGTFEALKSSGGRLSALWKEYQAHRRQDIAKK